MPNSEALFLPTLGAAACLEADVKLKWPEMALGGGEQAQKTEPPKRYGLSAGTSDDNGGKETRRLGQRPLEKWLQLRLGNIPKGLTFRRLNEEISLMASKVGLCCGGR